MIVNFKEINKHIEDFSLEYLKRNLDFKPFEKQLQFFNAGLQAPQRLFLAGNRTGKTYSALIETFFHATGLYPSWYNGYKFNFAPTIWSCSFSVEKVRDVLQYALIGNEASNTKGLIHPSLITEKQKEKTGIYHTIYIQHISGGKSTIKFKTYGQGEHTFQSDRVNFIHLDEQATYDLYMECLSRLMDVDGKGQGRIVVTEFPRVGMDELIAYFMLRTDVKIEKGINKEETYQIPSGEIHNGKFYLHASWNDNPNLTEETKELMRLSMKPHELEAREHGIPTIGDGMVYQIPESVFVVSPFDIPDHWARFAGMDLGWEDHTAVVFFAWDKDNDCRYIYKDYKYNYMTPETHAGILLPQGLDWIPTICDPAGNMRQQSDGETLLSKYEQAGLKLIKGKRTRESSIMEIIQLINTDRLKIFSSCRNLLSEMRTYSRKDGKVIDGNDHLMNAMEYPILLSKNYAITKMEYDTYSKYNYRSKVQLI